MSARQDRWGDEDPRPRLPRERGGMSPAPIMLLAGGGLFVVGALACGGLMWLGYTRAERARGEAEDADRAEAHRRIDDLHRAVEVHGDRRINGQIPDVFIVKDDPPPPKPGFEPAAEPPPQPKPTAFATDDVKNPGRWRVLFRSKKPELWNTNTQAGDDFAIPLQSTPEKTKYLRLRRMDTGDAIILPMTRGRIGRVDPPGPRVRWNGEGKDDYG
jgi:hypothetical protein